MIESMEMEDVITDLIDSQLHPIVAERALLSMGYGACEELYAPASATHLVLVYSNSDYAFTSYDLSWLDIVDLVLSYKINEDMNIFFIEMGSNIEDYYVDATAVIKIFNVAFPVKNFFVFRVSENIAFGVAREFDSTIPNNFAVSGLLNKDNLECFEELLYELPSSEFSDLPGLIINSSPQEKDGEQEYGNPSLSTDYLGLLSELESFYGIYASLGRAKSWEDFSDIEEPICTYKTACEELKNLVEKATTSSYEDLEAAQTAEEKTRNIQILNSEDKSVVTFNNESLGFSEKAFEDAEQMLKEILQKDN